MKLQELIDELSAATDGATLVPNSVRDHEAFKSVKKVWVQYMKRYERELEVSQQEILVENMDTPEERAYYNKDRVPTLVQKALVEPVLPNATPEEIKENLDSLFAGRKFWDVNIQSGAEAGVVTAVFYDEETQEAVYEAYRVTKDAKGSFSLFKIKG